MASGRYRFGVFEFDPEGLDLRRDGVAIHLQAQPKQLLASLVRNADRIVSREELRRAIWGEQTFVDFERGLNFCISQVRSALGDDAASPTYVRTFARQGYQFIAPVQWIPPITQTSESPSIAVVPRGRRALLIVTAIVLMTICVFAGYSLHVHRLASQPRIVAVVRFDNETGNAAMTRFSDDLTDNFVERLTSLSNGRYVVIGNAQVLRTPRDTRDLTAIAASLRANFVVLGQVQGHAEKTRILVHLIHMPEQTHISVGRIDQVVTDPLAVEDEAAQRIAADFSRRLSVIGPVTSSLTASR